MKLKKLGKMCAEAGELRVITLTNADGEYLGQMAGLVRQLTPPADARTAQDLEAVLRLALREVERG